MTKSHYAFPQKSTKIKKFWGLLEYKPRWGLTVQAWLIFLFAATLTGLIAIAQIQPFLAVSAPIQAEALIIEGWADDLVVEGAMAEFKRGNYQLLLTTGGPIGKGSYLAQYKTFAELAAATLIALKFPPDRIIAIPTPSVKTDRTAASAREVKNWLSQTNINIGSVNIYSYDVHTRRSWWIFKSILEPEVKVGAIAHPALDYEPKKWFTSSAGVRSIISETVAYFYARFIWKI
jgi:hypothetical protein